MKALQEDVDKEGSEPDGPEWAAFLDRYFLHLMQHLIYFGASKGGPPVTTTQGSLSQTQRWAADVANLPPSASKVTALMDPLWPWRARFRRFCI